MDEMTVLTPQQYVEIAKRLSEAENNENNDPQLVRDAIDLFEFCGTLLTAMGADVLQAMFPDEEESAGDS